MNESTATVDVGESGWWRWLRGALTSALWAASLVAFVFASVIGFLDVSRRVRPGSAGPGRSASEFADSILRVLHTVELGVSRVNELMTRAHESVRAVAMARLSSLCLE